MCPVKSMIIEMCRAYRVIHNKFQIKAKYGLFSVIGKSGYNLIYFNNIRYSLVDLEFELTRCSPSDKFSVSYFHNVRYLDVELLKY